MSDDQVQLCVVSRTAPAIYSGRETEFGIQDKKKLLEPGELIKSGLSFTVTATAKNDDGVAKFSGPFIHRGNGGKQHLYIGWRYLGDETWINRLKVQLEMPWSLAAKAVANDLVLRVDAYGPEWGVLKNWHALSLGEWKLS